MTALLLLQPATPMLFQGQEFSASAPFLYFADFEPELAAAVRTGRGEFLAQFPSVVETQRRGALRRSRRARRRSSAASSISRERESHAAAYALHGDLLRLRREDAVFAAPRPQRRRRRRAVGLGVRAALLHGGSSRRSAAGRQPRRRSAARRRSRSRCSRRRQARTGSCAGRAKIRRTAGRGRPSCCRTSGGTSRRNRRWC